MDEVSNPGGASIWNESFKGPIVLGFQEDEKKVGLTNKKMFHRVWGCGVEVEPITLFTHLASPHNLSDN